MPPAIRGNAACPAALLDHAIKTNGLARSFGAPEKPVNLPAAAIAAGWRVGSARVDSLGSGKRILISFTIFIFWHVFGTCFVRCYATLFHHHSARTLLSVTLSTRQDCADVCLVFVDVCY